MSSTGTLTGSPLLIQIQIALVGILIVLGVFFIWRAVSRIDQRLRVVEINQKALTDYKTGGGGTLSQKCPISSSFCGLNPNIQTFSTAIASGLSGNGASEFTEIDEFADEMIKAFGNNDISGENYDGLEIHEVGEETLKNSEYDENKMPNTATTTTANIEITPIKSVSKQQANDEVLSEAGTESGNPLSKSKLKQMNLEKLKAICVHHNISAEGSKSVLISRILGEIRD